MASLLSNKPLDSVSETDLLELIEASVPESGRIEYKSVLPGNNDEAKRELLADVSSFANASGGDILYGVEESGGVPSGIPGIDGVDQDAEIRRIESIILTGIEPRILGLRLRWIPMLSGGAVLIIRIPRSWALPHVVSFKGMSRFYSRNSAGKYQLSLPELRSLFTLSSGVEERIRQFRMGRLARIVTGEGAFALAGTAIFVLHLFPIASFVEPDLYDLENANGKQTSLAPIRSSSWDFRYNFDGFTTFSPGEEGVTGYVQAFRNGVIESADVSLLFPWRNKPAIYADYFEAEVVEKLSEYIRFQRQLGVQSPLIVGMSLLGVRGYSLVVSDLFQIPGRARAVDRDDLIVPEILIEDLHAKPADALKPAFDAIWNAAGWSGSRNYQNGHWVKPQNF